MPSRAVRHSSAWRLLAAGAAAVFGLATLTSGGRVLLGPDAARAAVGQYVPFFVAADFAFGFGYVAAAAALALGRRAGVRLSVPLAAGAVLLAAFGVLVAAGGAWEVRTLAALALRAAFWIALAALAPRLLPRPRAGAVA